MIHLAVDLQGTGEARAAVDVLRAGQRLHLLWVLDCIRLHVNYLLRLHRHLLLILVLRMHVNLHHLLLVCIVRLHWLHWLHRLVLLLHLRVEKWLRVHDNLTIADVLQFWLFILQITH